MNNKNLAIKTLNGSVIMEDCGCCLHISFLNIIWSVNINTFYLLNKYVKDLLINKDPKNYINDKKILLGMEGIRMMVSVTLDELNELIELLDLTLIEFKRKEFEKLL